MSARVFYKATRPNATDFRTGTVTYTVGESVEITGERLRQPATCCTISVLHASVTPHGTLIGGSWPCRLFEVTGRPVAGEGDKRGFRKLTVVREIEAHLALGPQGAQLRDLIGQASRVTLSEARSMAAAWAAAGDAAWDAAWAAARAAARAAAWDAARAAAWDAAWDAARAAAWDAARAAAGLTVRDLIGQHGFAQEHYDILTGPWRQVMGRIHPGDPEVSR